jgi:lycopene beta-cyclase
MQSPWDIIIVGGGLSGLSLAVELAEPEFSHLKVLVLERRTQFHRDRTWSYWATSPHRYQALERQRWHRWRVSHNGQTALHNSERPYCSIDADVFYNHALKAIAASSHVQVRLGEEVIGLKDGKAVEVQLANSGTAAPLSAHWVMDARPQTPESSGFLAQHFEGWELEADHDCFDVSTVDLMDFQASESGLHFFYVLPYSARRALVETTWISRWSGPPDYARQIKHYLARRWPGVNFNTVYKERGVLNLQTPKPAQHARIIPLGRNAGTLRPSTGFAFLNTVTDARTLASAIEKSDLSHRDTVLPTYKTSRGDQWMDTVFLQALESNPQNAPGYFMAMFKSVEPVVLTNFLSGAAPPLQRARLIKSLPKIEFLQAAWATLLK